MDAAEGTQSFASISAAVFELSRTSRREGAEFPPPPSGARVNSSPGLGHIVGVVRQARPKAMHITHFFNLGSFGSFGPLQDREG